jgi:hypothetical protein
MYNKRVVRSKLRVRSNEDGVRIASISTLKSAQGQHLTQPLPPTTRAAVPFLLATAASELELVRSLWNQIPLKI